MLSLLASKAFASPFMVLPKRGSAWSGGGGYSAATLAYKTRVEADGGTVADLDYVEALYAMFSSQSLSPEVWVSPLAGYKLNLSYCLKLYDLSSNDNDLVQGFEKTLPTYAADQQNGHPCIVCDGSHDILVGTVYAAATAFTLGAVIKEASIGEYRGYIANGNTSSNGFALGGDTSSKRCILAGGIAWNADGSGSTDMELVIGGYGGSMWMRVNGSAKSVANSGYNAPSGGSFQYGALDLPKYYHNRTMADGFGFSTSLSTAQCQAIEALINDWWAVWE